MNLSNSATMYTDCERGKHLTFEDRYSSKVFRKLKYSMRKMADEVNCSPPTVMYERRTLLKMHIVPANGYCNS